MKGKTVNDDALAERIAQRKATAATVLEYLELGESLCREGGCDPRRFWLAVRVAADDRGGLTEEVKQPWKPKRVRGGVVRLTDDDWMPFGKHRYELLRDVPDSYFRWFLEQDWCDEWPSLVEYANVMEREE